MKNSILLQKTAVFTGKIRKTPSSMQTITQSVVESYAKLVYKYIKQDVEAENNHTAKGKEIGYVYRIKRHQQNIWEL